jgi:hypothetical protein
LKDVRGGTCSMADGCFYDEDVQSIQVSKLQKLVFLVKRVPGQSLE